MKKACDRDMTLLKQALKTFDSRLNIVLTRVSEEKLDAHYANSQP